MNIKKSCATCLALLSVCSFNCSGVFASSKSLDDLTMFSRHKRKRHNAISVRENKYGVMFNDYKEVKSIFETPRVKKYETEEPEMKKVIINKGVETIDRKAFFGRNDIREVIIPETVKYIEEYAFADCVNLNNIVIKGDVLIGEHSFEGCENLIEISIEGRINGLFFNSFSECKNLSIIRLGSFHMPNDRVIKAIMSFNAYRDEFGNLIYGTIVI